VEKKKVYWLRLDGMVRLRLRSVFAYGFFGLTLRRTVFAFAINIFLFAKTILAGGARRSCVSSEDWHPLRDSLINQTAPIKYALSTIQTLFAELNR